MSRDAARREARRRFGGVDQARERFRDASGFPSLDELAADVRYSLRMIRRQPGFAVDRRAARRDWRRRQHGDLLARQRHPAAAARLPCRRSPCRRPQRHPGDGADVSERAGRCRRVPALAVARDRVRQHRRGEGRHADADGRGRRQSRRNRACHVGAASDARRAAHPGTRVPGRRRSRGPRGRRDAHVSKLAAALRRRPLRSGPLDHPRRQAVHRHRRSARGLPISAPGSARRPRRPAGSPRHPAACGLYGGRAREPRGRLRLGRHRAAPARRDAGAGGRPGQRGHAGDRAPVRRQAPARRAGHPAPRADGSAVAPRHPAAWLVRRRRAGGPRRQPGEPAALARVVARARGLGPRSARRGTDSRRPATRHRESPARRRRRRGGARPGVGGNPRPGRQCARQPRAPRRSASRRSGAALRDGRHPRGRAPVLRPARVAPRGRLAASDAARQRTLGLDGEVGAAHAESARDGGGRPEHRAAGRLGAARRQLRAAPHRRHRSHVGTRRLRHYLRVAHTLPGRRRARRASTIACCRRCARFRASRARRSCRSRRSRARRTSGRSASITTRVPSISGQWSISASSIPATFRRWASR